MSYYNRIVISILSIAACMLTSTSAMAYGPQLITTATNWNCFGASYTSTAANTPALTIKASAPVALNGCKFNNALGTVVLIETTSTFTCTNCIITGGQGSAIVVTTPATAPASAIATVTLDHSNISGGNTLIDIHNFLANQGSRGGVNLTVNNSYITGVNPNVANQPQGRFIVGSSPHTLVVTRNNITNTAGIKINGLGKPMAGPLLISKNSVSNINGRLSTGNNGYYPQTSELVQFVQLGYLKSNYNKSMEISWNQVINQPGQSGVEDNINIYQSEGTQALPLLIANNFIRGAYPLDMNSASFSGGGIITDGADPTYTIHTPSYVKIDSNQVVDTVNYGISIAAGHHNSMTNNTVVGVNRLPSGKISKASNIGMTIWMGAKYGTSAAHPVLTPEEIAFNADIDANFHDNSATNNKVGWTRYDGTVDANGDLTNPAGLNVTYWFQTCNPDPMQCVPNQDLGLPALNAANVEFTNWQTKLSNAGVTVGPNWQ